MNATTIHLDGKPYVILPREEYDRMTLLAKAPPLPDPDDDGNYPAVEYARASLARKIIRERAALGLNQKELAELAGLTVETLCRIETGKQTPSTASIAKIDHALQRAAKRKRRTA